MWGACTAVFPEAGGGEPHTGWAGRRNRSGIHLAETAEKQLQWPKRVERVGVLLSGIELLKLKAERYIVFIHHILQVAEKRRVLRLGLLVNVI